MVVFAEAIIPGKDCHQKRSDLFQSAGLWREYIRRHRFVKANRFYRNSSKIARCGRQRLPETNTAKAHGDRGCSKIPGVKSDVR